LPFSTVMLYPSLVLRQIYLSCVILE
jgi:hypothetical protein